MVVLAGFDAARVVGILVGQSEGRVAHLVERNFGGARREREDADRSAAPTIDLRVHDDQDDGELRDLRQGDLEGDGVVADQQPAQAVGSEARIEVRGGSRAGAAGGNRVVRAGLVRGHVDAEDIEGVRHLTERVGPGERGHERRTRQVEVALLRVGEAFGEQHDVERLVARGGAEDLRRADDDAVSGAHRFITVEASAAGERKARDVYCARGRREARATVGAGDDAHDGHVIGLLDRRQRDGECAALRWYVNPGDWFFMALGKDFRAAAECSWCRDARERAFSRIAGVEVVPRRAGARRAGLRYDHLDGLLRHEPHLFAFVLEDEADRWPRLEASRLVGHSGLAVVSRS